MNGLVVGPNVSILASELPGVFESPSIASILVPSDWVRHHWIADSPSLAEKIKVWPSGVDFRFWRPEPADKRNSRVLLYVKTKSDPVVDQARSALRSSGYELREVEYGDYSPRRYLQALRECGSVVYIGGSESQGLALLEAWATNVPTFVYDAPRQEIVLKDRSIVLTRGEFSPAPYLTSDVGAIWTQPEELPELCSRARDYAPRRSVEGRFSDAETTKAYLSLFD